MRRAFTLVEMLAVVGIIGIIASVLLGAYFMAMESARKSRTRALLVRLDQAAMQRIEAYEVYRLPMTVPGAIQPDEFGAAQLVFLREVMRMELPDCYADLNLQHHQPMDQVWIAEMQEWSFDSPVLAGGCRRPDMDPSTPATEQYLPTVARIIQAKVISAARSLAIARRADPNDPAEISASLDQMDDENQSAEMLYQILTLPNDDEAGEAYKPPDYAVADTDGDGMPEVVDGWGSPFEWIRWPAGYCNVDSITGAVHFNTATMSDDHWGYVTDRQTPDPVEYPDWLNPRRVEVVPNSEPLPLSPEPTVIFNFQLSPLIVSPGPDHAYGLVFKREVPKTWPDTDKAMVRQQYSDPYYYWQEQGTGFVRRRGQPVRWDFTQQEFDEQPDTVDGDDIGEWVHLDNITNHYAPE